MKSARLSVHKLAELVHKFARTRVLVVGDAMMDLYHFGRVERLSPEAPVPVFIEERQKGRPGGAANVACNLEALGCQIMSVMPHGPDITKKHRYMVGHHHLFRIDRDVCRQPTQQDLQAAREAVTHVDAIVLSDYAKGWLTREMCQAVIGQGKPVIVDPKGSDWKKYFGATCICPNEHEWNSMEAQYAAVLQKRGPNGIRLWSGGQFRDFPAQARHVFDVTGAGDTVVSVVAATLGAGGTLQDAAILANFAAGIVVGKVGTAECSAEELLCALDSQTDVSTSSTPDTASSSGKPANTATGSSWPSTPMNPYGDSRGMDAPSNP